jgi:hypothetical protein
LLLLVVEVVKMERKRNGVIWIKKWVWLSMNTEERMENEQEWK